jgi:hypothetical protein
MIIAALTLALALPQTAQDLFPDGGGAAFVARARDELGKCGVMARPFSVADEDVHEQVMVTLDETNLTSAEVECLANNPELDGITFAFADNRFETLYQSTRNDRPDIRAAMTDAAQRQRAWLEERGLLAGMPVFDPAKPLSTWTAAVETHCGADPRSIIVADDARRSLSPVATGPYDDKTGCVFGVLILAMSEQTAPSSLITGEDSAP